LSLSDKHQQLHYGCPKSNVLYQLNAFSDKKVGIRKINRQLFVALHYKLLQNKIDLFGFEKVIFAFQQMGKITFP